MITIFELAKHTETEEAAITFAINNGLINIYAQKCHKCGNNMMIERGKIRHGINGRYRCINRACRASRGLLKGSIFEFSHLSLANVIRIMYFYSMDFKVTDCEIHCGLTRKTCIRWYKIFRRICEAFQMSQKDFKIGGPGLTVEVDETYVCKRKYNRGRVLVCQSVWLIGGICRETGGIFLSFDTKRDASTLTSIISRSISSESRIITDCWRGYLKLTENGFYHATVNHTYNFVSPVDPTVHTQRVERLWRTIKNFIPKNVRREFLESYGAAFQVSREIGVNGKLYRFKNYIEIIRLYFG